MAKLSSDNIAKFKPQTRNGNKHTQRGMGMLESSMRQYGYVSPMTAAADGEIIDGSARIETSANVFGDDAIVVHHDGTKPIIMVRDDIPSADTPEARAISMAANRIAQVNLDFDAEVILGDLNAGVDLEQFWRPDELDALIATIGAPAEAASSTQEQARATLAERFLIPPFSVLDARQGYWQARKSAWIALGIQSELGRGENALDMSASMAGITDPAAVAECSTQRRQSPRHKSGGASSMAMHDSANFPTPLARKRSYDAKR